jgi:outer membrane biosynthesis protein TonB
VEVNAKVKELEDEVKVLKAEIRNVLLDIREAILDNTNPLAEQEPAYLRMDLTTTARSMAAEEATRAARDAMEQARAEQPTESEPEEPEADVPAAPPPEDEVPEEEAMGEEPTESEPEEPETEEPEAEVPEEETTAEEVEAPEEEAMAEQPTESEPVEPETDGDGGLPPKPTQIPSAAYLASLLPTGANGGLAAWVTEAMAAIGPQDLERVIAIHRLWGSLPPNISYALAHLQRLIRSSPKEADPPWLKTMRDLERLASC